MKANEWRGVRVFGRERDVQRREQSWAAGKTGGPALQDAGARAKARAKFGDPKTTIPFILSLLTAAFLFGCSTDSPRGDYSGTHPTDIVVMVTCSEPGTRFTGTIVVDGHSQGFSGTGAGSFPASGHEFICSFQKVDPAGSITLSVSEAGRNLGESATTLPSGGVRAELLRTRAAQHTIFTTFE